MVVKYLVWKYDQVLCAGMDLRGQRSYLEEILSCLQHTDLFMTLLYRSGLFLQKRRLALILRHGHEMLRLYSRCAALAHAKLLPRFKFNPKFHMLCHILLDLQQQAAANKSPVNPLSASCQMPEDFINRCSTLSRNVSSKLVAMRMLDMYKVCVASTW